VKRVILITGAGGIGGFNFCRALRVTGKYFIIGADHFKHHLVFPDTDVKVQTPKHSDSEFIQRIRCIVEKYGVKFIHPQPTVEAYEISRRRRHIPARVYLPTPEAMERGFDKLETARILEKHNVLVPKTTLFPISGEVALPAWVRVRRGAGGMLSILCNSLEEVEHWTTLWNERGVTKDSDWMVQEYIGGRDVAWDSLWFNGKLITSYARERLEYPFKHLTPSGVGGTPIVARIIEDDEVNEVGRRAVSALDEKPHGFYCLDFKHRDRPYVTEVNVGKAHTTLALWSYAMHRFLGKQSIPDLYVQIGLENEAPGNLPEHDLYPEGYYLIRHMDCGSWIWREDGWKRRVV